VGEETVKVHVR